MNRGKKKLRLRRIGKYYYWLDLAEAKIHCYTPANVAWLLKNGGNFGTKRIRRNAAASYCFRTGYKFHRYPRGSVDFVRPLWHSILARYGLTILYLNTQKSVARQRPR